ncbi:uncharacterized protein LOC143445929 [Clavelina lepadiformis]|uniref:uncharacterized protein LOC143445929 n=1 Tax=Clavelina lepadiformis TaxID=159417 RepID=UPI004042DE77
MPRTPAFSKLEHEFLLKAISTGVRLDQRDMLEYRKIGISFGIDYGCCTVEIGETKVMAQVAAEMDRPRESRPSEGRLNVHVEMSTIAFPSFDPTKPGELGVGIQRMLERSIILSRAVDLEALCVRVGEKSWTIHLHVHVLSHDGNLIDCASIAAITALKHFRYPDVSVIGQDIVIHTMEEKHPIPLTVHHMPLYVSLAFFKGCERLAIDPTYLEEKVMDGKIILSINKHKELCSLQMNGQMNITKEQILRCTEIAAVRAKTLTELILNAIKTDTDDKKLGKTKSQTVSEKSKDNKDILKSELTVNSQTSEEIQIANMSINEDAVTDDAIKNGHNNKTEKPYWLTQHDRQTCSIGDGKVNAWSGDGAESSLGIFKALREDTEPEEKSEDENEDSEEEVVILDDSALET